MAQERPLTKNIRPGQEPLDLKGYEQAGGYQALRKALKTMTPEQVQEEVSKSGLRGRGGAGFPTGKKWEVMLKDGHALHPRYLVVNADEMEPGTFKDRFLLEGDPNLMVESAILTAYGVRANIDYIFLRWAYKPAEERLRRAMVEAIQAGYLGQNILGSNWGLELHLHVSAGRYICGEETGLLNALEGERASPRAKPPYPHVSGLWGRPTTVNNVETLCNVPAIIMNGGDWYRKLSRTTDGGTKLYGVSGHVKRPGVWELPMGTTLRELLYEHAGGMQEGYKFRGAIPGGASTDFLLEEHLDTPMDFETLPKVGSRLGTGTAIVLDDRTCPVGMVANLQKFFAQESCGWCTPCRDGLPWVARTLDILEEGRGEPEDLDVLAKHAKFIRLGHTFCALAPGAMEPLQSSLKYFRDDYERHIREKRCPYKE